MRGSTPAHSTRIGGDHGHGTSSHSLVTSGALRAPASSSATASSDQGERPADILALLEKARLTQYGDAVLAYVRSEAFGESLAASVGMKQGHMARLKSVLRGKQI